MNHKTCPSCNREAIVDELASNQLALASAPTDCTILKCVSCNMRWLIPFPVINEGDSLYDRDYYTSSICGGASYSDKKTELELCYRITAKRFLSLGVTENLLDVGCGTGDFLSIAKAQGLDGEGVEPSRFAASEAVARGIPTHHGFIDEFVGSGRRLSAIHCSHVLEHTLDVNVFLSQLNELLEPGAPIYLEVPYQFDGILDRINGIRGIKPVYTKHSIHHHYFFNPAVLGTLLRRHGFHVLTIGTHLPCRRARRRQNIRTRLLQSILYTADKVARKGDLISVWARKSS